MIILLNNASVNNWQYLHTSRLDVESNQNAYLFADCMISS